MWLQKEIRLKEKRRGFHLISGEILAQLPELSRINIGLAHTAVPQFGAANEKA